MSRKEAGTCEGCGAVVPQGEGVRRVVNRKLPWGGRYAPSTEEVDLFLCSECERYYRRFPVWFWAGLVGLIAGLLLLVRLVR